MRSDRRVCLLVVAVALAGCAPESAPAADAECVHVVAEDGTRGSRCLPTAPRSARVDLATPVFSRPTSVTNPLHPTGSVHQTVYGGQVDVDPFRSEVTLLPARKTIVWRGQRIEALVSQYLSLSGGRIAEVALDWYAQADDGSVWYLGEDVYNYENGEVADTAGTWIAGPKVAPAMIMPARPRPGDVYRPENAPPVVFEEVTVSSVDQTVPGPSGDVTGAITVEELHLDGTREKKTFAPGYGEFSTGNPAGDLEAATLALPTDAASGPVPATVDTLIAAAERAAGAVSQGWPAAASAADAVVAAWSAARPTGLPQLVSQMSRDLTALTTAVADHDAAGARNAALRVSQNALDLHSIHEPVDRERFAMWARQLRLDAAAGDRPAALGDHACLKWTLDRIEHDLPDPAAVTAALSAQESALARGDLADAAARANTLLTLA